MYTSLVINMGVLTVVRERMLREMTGDCVQIDFTSFLMIHTLRTPTRYYLLPY